jgi:diguanylate cyclase (GGDEF)-like protein
MTNAKHSHRVFWSHSLSTQLMIKSLIAALLVGGLLNVVQILWEAGTAASQIDDDTYQLLDVVKVSATQAVYSIDPELAERVIEGLFAKRAIKYAGIFHPDKTVLAEKSRELAKSSSRWLTDLLLGKERAYQISLTRTGPDSEVYGTLEVKVDTAHASTLLVQRSTNNFFTGLVRAVALALVLYLLFYLYLTRPLKMLTESLATTNPAEPGSKAISFPPHHKNDEFGVLAWSANNLLQAIDEHQQKRHAAEARIIRLSQYDSLTGLPTRRLFNRYLESAIEEASTHGNSLAVICIGIDDFKSINEQFGYDRGDKLLQAFAEKLIGFRDYVQTSCRLAGDQFAIILYNITNSYKTANYAEQLLTELAKPFTIEDRVIVVNSTIGISIFPDDAVDADRVLQKAEQTMLHAKTEGASQFHFYVASLDHKIRARKHLEKDLLQAITNQELTVVYQPQVDLKEKTVTGAEVLVRWLHKERGAVPPDIFIPVAESNGCIYVIGEWVLAAACQQIRIWEKEGLDITLAVNVSALQLKQEGFVESVWNTLQRNEVAPEKIELEVTETSFMEDIDNAINILTQLNRLGINSAVDDFGTGYSSLSYLKQLPVSKIKIDKQFVSDLLAEEEDAQIVHAIIQLGHSLKLKVVAEGVETREQEAFLVQDHCDIAQGYYYSKPITSDEFTRYLSSQPECRRVVNNP